MRSALALGVLIALSASANAASVHRSHARHVIVDPPGQRVTAPGQHSFAVPGWTEEETRRWMDLLTVYP
jgi:hypothetical protein